MEIMRKDLNDARDLHGQAESAAAVWKASGVSWIWGGATKLNCCLPGCPEEGLLCGLTEYPGTLLGHSLARSQQRTSFPSCSLREGGL